MSRKGTVLYSIDEIVLIPSTISFIDSRSQCNPTYSGRLPLFISPMSCLTNALNYEKFYQKGFNPIIPRNIPWTVREREMLKGNWIAVGLDEGYRILKNEVKYRGVPCLRVCIDIANGHQCRSYELCESLKKVFPQLILMVGNIAKPKAYREYAACGADYIRIGIGSGQVCTTSVQSGIHYPMASLITECREIKESLPTAPKIIADGGFKYVDQIVKALALGADYVMIGWIAAGFPEACGATILKDEDLWEEPKLHREYYGMSTEKAQREMHPEPDYVPKHTEGTVRYVPVMGSTQAWIDDFTHALRSCMSYCNARELKDFVGNVDWGIQNPTTFNAYIKS